jgi:hypothetical protein
MSDLAKTTTPADLTAWHIDDLRSELARCLTLTAQTLVRAAAVFVELERRGEDLSELRKGWGWTFPMIASGQLAAEAVVRFCGMTCHLKALIGLPLDRQRKIAAGEPIEVVMRDDPKVTVQLPLKQVRADLLPVVFQNGELLPPDVQRANLQTQAKALRKQEQTPARTYHVRKVGDTLKVGNSIAKVGDVLEALTAEAGPDRLPPGPKEDPAARDYKTAVVRLWPDEHAALVDYCRSVDLPENEVIRKALRMIGALNKETNRE